MAVDILPSLKEGDSPDYAGAGTLSPFPGGSCFNDESNLSSPQALRPLCPRVVDIEKGCQPTGFYMQGTVCKTPYPAKEL